MSTLREYFLILPVLYVIFIHKPWHPPLREPAVPATEVGDLTKFDLETALFKPMLADPRTGKPKPEKKIQKLPLKKRTAGPVTRLQDQKRKSARISKLAKSGEN